MDHQIDCPGIPPCEACAAKDAEITRLRDALGLCAIPLEALAATEVPGTALCPEIQEAIIKAVSRLRSVITGPGVRAVEGS